MPQKSESPSIRSVKLESDKITIVGFDWDRTLQSEPIKLVVSAPMKGHVAVDYHRDRRSICGRRTILDLSRSRTQVTESYYADNVYILGRGAKVSPLSDGVIVMFGHIRFAVRTVDGVIGIYLFGTNRTATVKFPEKYSHGVFEKPEDDLSKRLMRVYGKAAEATA